MTEKLSKSHAEAIEKITALREYMTERLHIPEEHCWFIQTALIGVSYRTLWALKDRGYLEQTYTMEFGDYYRWIGKEIE